MDSLRESLRGKVALVTGAGSGIGRATALMLAEAGVRVGALTLKATEADATQQEILRRGGDGLALAADVTVAAELQEAIHQLDGHTGRIDIVVANAGINGVWAPLLEIEETEWQQTLDTNLKGTFLTVKHALPALRRRGGSVVIVSSINGTRIFSNSGATAYAVSKAGQVAFGRMIALELARDGIRVNTVCPGAIDTQIEDNTKRRHLEDVKQPVEFPEGTVPLTHGASGSADQVANVICFLASDLASHVTGTEVYVDGAQSLLQG